MMKSCDLKTVPAEMVEHIDRVLVGEYDLPKNLRWKEGAIAYVLDIGANVGAFTRWALEKWPECRVMAYEPVPENAYAWMDNVTGELRERALLVEVAVGKRQGTAVFYRGLNNSGTGSLTNTGEQDVDRPITVQTTDAAMLKGYDFVKIDAEGYEDVILARLPLDNVRGVALEWHAETTRAWCVQHLTDAGFDRVSEEFMHATRGTQVWVRPEWVEDATVAEVGKKKVFLAMPVYGGYDPHFVTSLMGLMNRPPCTLMVHPVIGDSLVARARNRAAAKFLQTDCTHLLFLDTDLIFSSDHIARLISHDEPVVAGLYPKKQIELGWVCNMLPDEEMDERGLKPVRYAGTGCLLISRSILEAMISVYPELEYDPDDGDEPGVKWDFFSCGVFKDPETGKRRYLSEDWWFCQRVLELGEKVWMDTQVVLKHVGQFIYPFDNIEDFAEPAPNP